jgi:hypothetical protein
MKSVTWSHNMRLIAAHLMEGLFSNVKLHLLADHHDGMMPVRVRHLLPACVSNRITQICNQQGEGLAVL